MSLAAFDLVYGYHERIIGRDMWHIQEQLKGTAARKYLKRETRDEWTDKTRNFIKILGLRLSSWLSIYIFWPHVILCMDDPPY